MNHVFVTGATGFIGSRVVDQLLAAGYQVSGLVRSDAGAEALSAKGGKPVRGDLHSLDTIAEAARAADAVLHLAFIHDFTNMEASFAAEDGVVRAINGALEGSGKPFVATSGTGTAGDTGDGLAPNTAGDTGKRAEVSEHAALEGAQQGVRAMVIRLPQYVYGDGSSFFTDVQAKVAKANGFAAAILPGSQKVSVVHVDDAAAAYLAAMRHGKAGQVYNIVGENGIQFQKITEAVAAKLGGLPVRAVSVEEAQQIYPPALVQFWSMNNQADNSLALEELGWRPRHTSGFLADIAGGGATVA